MILFGVPKRQKILMYRMNPVQFGVLNPSHHCVLHSAERLWSVSFLKTWAWQGQRSPHPGAQRVSLQMPLLQTPSLSIWTVLLVLKLAGSQPRSGYVPFLTVWSSVIRFLLSCGSAGHSRKMHKFSSQSVGMSPECAVCSVLPISRFTVKTGIRTLFQRPSIGPTFRSKSSNYPWIFQKLNSF